MAPTGRTRKRRLEGGEAGAAPAADPLQVAADRLHSASIHLLRGVRRTDEDLGLSPPRLSALSVLVFGGAMTLGQLARAEQVRAPTMSQLVRALEQDGLIVRSVDPTDARVVWLRATPRAVALLQKGRGRRTSALADALARLASKDQRRVLEALGALEEIARLLRESNEQREG